MQGQSRRIFVKIVQVPNSGNGPLVCDSITSVEMGSVYLRNRYDEPLDSYQESDLERCGLIRSVVYVICIVDYVINGVMP